MALKIIWNNIINEPADVIVTPASRKPRVGTGLDRAIHEAGGKGLTAARLKLGTIEPGVVKHTPSFGLAAAKCKAKYVIHALGPFCETGRLDGTERPLLFGCYLQILCTAVVLKAKTVSIPVMSSGKFGMPIPLAVDTAVEAIQLFLAAVPRLKVKLVGIDRDFYDYAVAHYPQLTESHFDMKSVDAYRKGRPRFRTEDESIAGGEFAEREDSRYFGTVRFRRDTNGKSFKKIFQGLWQSAKSRARAEWESIPRRRRGKKKDGDYLLRYEDLAFCSGVPLRKIRRYLSSSSHTTPPRDTIVLLSLAMRVPFDYFRELLQRCKYPVERGEMESRDWLVMEWYREGKIRSEIDAELSRRGYSILQQC